MKADDERCVYAIRLDMDEARLVFEALAEQPFKRVFGLIGSLNRQANELTARNADVATRQAYRIDGAEFELVVHALSAMPYGRVHGLLANLNEQARTHAEPAARADEREDERA